MEERHYNIFDYFNFLNKWKKTIIINMIIVIFFSIIISLIMPKTYRASAVIMPPLSDSNMGVFSPLMDSPFGGFFPAQTDETMSVIAILKSRTVLIKVIRKFNLIEYYKLDNIDLAINALKDNIVIDIDDEGTIRVVVDAMTNWFHPDDQEETSKQLSAEMANYFVKQLDIVNKTLQTQQATFQRAFIENRYLKNIEDLNLAEEKLRQFQERNNMISIADQTNAAIEAAASIKGHILAKEVRLEVLNNSYNSSHNDIHLLKNEISALNDQLNRMQYNSNPNKINSRELFPSFSKMPELETQLRQLMREVEIQNTLFTFLTQQYEEAKINEAKDTPTIQVLDPAVKPIIKYKPFRTLIVISSSIIGLIFGILVSFVRERENNLF